MVRVVNTCKKIAFFWVFSGNVTYINPTRMIFLWDLEHFPRGLVFGDGTSPEGRLIRTHESNCDCSSAIGEQRCMQRLFGMPSTMDVPTCLFLVFMAGFGYGTSPEGPKMGHTGAHLL